jgi:hypothetical protein
MKKSALFLVLAISFILLFSSAYRASTPTRQATQAFQIAPEEKVDPRIRPAVSSHTHALVDVYVETLDPHALGELLRSHGVETNIPLHFAVMNNEAFVRGDTHTRFIEEQNIQEEIKKIAGGIQTLQKRLAEVLWENELTEEELVAATAAVLSYVKSKETG